MLLFSAHMTPVKATHASPPPLSARVVPAVLGKGRVNLYDARAGLPALVNEPPGGEEFFQKVRYVLVHLPSRRWYATRSKRAALSILDEVKSGKSTEIVRMLVQTDEKPSPPARAHTKTKPVLTPPAVVAPAAGTETQAEQDKSQEAKKTSGTPVPDGLVFDKAMQFVFPVQRLTENYERLLHAQEEIFDREGNSVGFREAYSVQFQTLKALTEYMNGRPIEKEKTKDVKPPLTIQELRAKMILSDEYRAGILEMAADCAKEAEARKAQNIKPA